MSALHQPSPKYQSIKKSTFTSNEIESAKRKEAPILQPPFEYRTVLKDILNFQEEAALAAL